MSQNVLASSFTKVRVNIGLLMLILGVFFPKVLNEFVLLHFFGIKLHVEKEKNIDGISVCKFKYGARSSFCISMDFEIPIHGKLERAPISQQAISELLKIADLNDIPVTWAVVGKIVESAAPTYRESFEQIVASKGKYELASHTFNHVDFSSCSQEVAEQEILASKKSLGRFMRPTSFVFPFEREAHHNVLAGHQFTAYRGATESLGYPKKTHGMWNVSPTYFFSNRAFSLTALTLRIVLLRLVDLAIRYGCVLHIWGHPWAMDIQKDAIRYNRKVLLPLFNYIAKKRAKGLIWTCTMRELANYCEAQKNCTIQNIEMTDGEVTMHVNCEIKDRKFDFPPTASVRFSAPKRGKMSRARVFENGVEHSSNTTESGEPLILTLTFERPVKKIRVSMNP